MGWILKMLRLYPTFPPKEMFKNVWVTIFHGSESKMFFYTMLHETLPIQSSVHTISSCVTKKCKSVCIRISGGEVNDVFQVAFPVRNIQSRSVKFSHRLHCWENWFYNCILNLFTFNFFSVLNSLLFWYTPLMAGFFSIAMGIVIHRSIHQNNGQNMISQRRSWNNRNWWSQHKLKGCIIIRYTGVSLC